jgi:CheY-like chemotaxis protein
MSSIAPLPSQQSLPHILLIDDDPMWLMSTSKGLRDRGYIVTEYPVITPGLPELNDNPPDGAIVGERVAGQSGFEICRKLREHPAGAFVPVLWLSDQSDDAATRQAGVRGAHVERNQGSGRAQDSHLRGDRDIGGRQGESLGSGKVAWRQVDGTQDPGHRRQGLQFRLRPEDRGSEGDAALEDLMADRLSPPGQENQGPARRPGEGRGQDLEAAEADHRAV